MRRFLMVGLVVVLGGSGLSRTAQAQVPFSSFNDPFVAYYAYYLPRQQAQAMQPGPEATIAAAAANRQVYAATNRNEMFDTNSPGLGGDSGEFAPNSGIRRQGGLARASRIGGNLNGLGPAGYYNNNRGFHPTVRPGISRNNNVSVVRNRGFSGGGYGGLGGGLPGPR